MNNPANFLSALKGHLEADNFFKSFNIKDLFSPNWKITLLCLKQMQNIPSCVLTIVDELQMSLMANYLFLIMPSFFPDDYLKEFIRIINVVSESDADFLLSRICTRVTLDQKFTIISDSPNCSSFYEICGSYLLEADLFFPAFKRLFAKFEKIPIKDQRQILNKFSKAIFDHHQGKFLKDMILYLNEKNVSSDIINFVLSSFFQQRNSFPMTEILDQLPHQDIKSICSILLKRPHLSIMMMQLLLYQAKSTSPSLLNNQQCIYALWHYPLIFFNYVSKIELDDKFRIWITIICQVFIFPVNQTTIPLIFNTLANFFKECLTESTLIFIMNNEQILDWISSFLNNLDDSIDRLAIFGLLLLFLRTFESMASYFSSHISVKNYLNHAISCNCNIQSIADVLFWSFNYFDTKLDCPFDYLIETEELKESLFKILPPSTTFLFRISSILLTTLFSVSVSSAAPVNASIVSTPIRLFKQSESTNSRLRLNFKSSLKSTVKNPENAKTNILLSDQSNSLSLNSTKNEILNQSNEEFETIDKTNASTYKVNNLLNYIINKLLSMYEDSRLIDYLYPISNSQTLLPFIPYALETNNHQCFLLLGKALGLSCPFSVFSNLYDKIGSSPDDLDRTLKLFQIATKNSSIVTDSLYISSPIPITVLSDYQSASFWVRPIMSDFMTILQIHFKTYSSINIEISTSKIRISKGQEMDLPSSIDGWYLITINYSNSFQITVNLTNIKFPQSEHPPCNQIIIGAHGSCFYFQSARFFSAQFTNDDIKYLFALGPGFIEDYTTDFINIKESHSMYVMADGFISSLYLPFRDEYKFGKKIETPIFSYMINKFAPPYHLSGFTARNICEPEKNYTKLSSIPKIPTTKISSFANTAEDLIGAPQSPKIEKRSRSGSFSLNSVDKEKSKQSSISVDRRRAYSFLNSLHCVGGLHLLIHYIGEVLLKKPELGKYIWKILRSLFNRSPNVHLFFQKTRAYALVGHLLWSGQAKAKDTVDLALQKLESSNYYITNPEIVKSWLLEAQLFYSNMDDIIIFLKDAPANQHNYQVLKAANSFSKIVKLLCGPCYHTDEFLYLLGDFAVFLTEPITAMENAKLVFDRLMVCHFSFSSHDKKVQTEEEEISEEESLETNSQNPTNPSQDSSHSSHKKNPSFGLSTPILSPQASAVSHHKISSETDARKGKIQPSVTAALIRILRKILFEYPDVQLELELFIPAIITSEPSVQVALVTLLIQKMNYQYLLLLGRVLRDMPFLDSMEDSIFAMLTSSPLDFSKLTTTFLYFSTHLNVNSNSKECIIHVCDLIDSSLDIHVSAPTVVIAMNQSIDIIAAVDFYETSTNQNGLISKSLIPFFSHLLVHALSLNCNEEFLKFFLSLSLIPNIPIYLLAKDTLTLLVFIGRMIINRGITTTIFNQANEIAQTYIQQIASDAIQRLRLTPGEFEPSLFELLGNLIESLVPILSPQLCINFFIDLLHLELPSETMAKIETACKNKERITKMKRYQELYERETNPGCLPPKRYFAPFESQLAELRQKWIEKEKKEYIALFSLSCRSVHHQSCASVALNIGDPDSDAIVDLWHTVFNTLQFPGSKIYSECPVKWTISDHSANYMERQVLHPLNPAIDKNYEEYFSIKYLEDPPHIRLHLSEVLKFTPLTLHLARDVQFSGHVIRVSGISTYDGVLVFAGKKIRFYQRAKDSNRGAFCEEVLTINTSKINCITLKHWRHQKKGAEILCNDFAVYFFAFDTENVRDVFIDTMISSGISVQKEPDTKHLSETTKKWVDGSLSSFDYLLQLNSLSGRSWNDFTQYPIMPWVLADFESDPTSIRLDPQSIHEQFKQFKKDPKTNKDSNNVHQEKPKEKPMFRDLSLPIFAQTKELQNQCLSYYNTCPSMDEKPHCTPSYISNVGSTLYFMIRLEPFTNDEIDFQDGKLDVIDRCFNSISITYKLTTSLGCKSSLELVPELYFMPEVLMNVNNIHIPDSLISGKKFGDVILPRWAMSARDFVWKMRRALEMAPNLEQWIDLIWGVKRRSIDSFNVFQPSVYEFNPEDARNSRVILKALIYQIQNCGQAAAALFTKSPHPPRSFSPLSLAIEGSLVPQPLKRFARVSPLNINQNVTKKLVRSSKTSFEAFQLRNGVIEGIRGNQASPLLSFAEELSITCFDVSDTFLLTGHLLPVVNVWKLKSGLSPVTSLIGHLSQITTIVLFDPKWRLFAAGHQDGKVSLFSLNPMRFLRCLKCAIDDPVVMLRTSPPTGDFLAVQSHGHTNTATLFTPNGMPIASFYPDGKILDAAFTVFTDGIKDNYVFILLESGILRMLSVLNMGAIASYKIEHPNPVFLTLSSRDPFNLYVTHLDGQLTSYKIV